MSEKIDPAWVYPLGGDRIATILFRGNPTAAHIETLRQLLEIYQNRLEEEEVEQDRSLSP